MGSRRRLLGEVLVADGTVSAEEMTRALARRQVAGERLGDTLVALGLTTEEDVARALATQLRLTYLPENEVKADAKAAALVSPTLARERQMLPLRILDERALVAMCDPLDEAGLNQMRRLLQRAVDVVVVTPRALANAIMAQERLAAVAAGAMTSTAMTGEGVDAPIVRLVDELVNRALAGGASDIHVEPGPDQLRIRLRVDGMLHEIMSPPMAHHAAVVARIKVMAGMDITERRIPQDGRVELRDGGRNVDLRVSSFPTVFGEKVVLRLFNRAQAIRDLGDLGMEGGVFQGYTAAVRRAHGMVLVTGPTGSGKTSTLLSTLARLVTAERNIVTIEDPVEYLVEGVSQCQINPKAGLTFASGLRSILRQDPNVIMVGEIRDPETADVAVRAALTGHLVLSTLHTGDAAGALTRLADMGVEPYLIASAVLGVLAQRLVRTLCVHCRRPHPPEPALFERHGVPLPASSTCFTASGCSECHGTGYAGRQAIFEFLPVTPGIQAGIHRKATNEDLRAAARAEGLVPMVEMGLRQALAGQTTPAEVLRVVGG